MMISICLNKTFIFPNMKKALDRTCQGSDGDAISAVEGVLDRRENGLCDTIFTASLAEILYFKLKGNCYSSVLSFHARLRNYQSALIQAVFQFNHLFNTQSNKNHTAVKTQQKRITKTNLSQPINTTSSSKVWAQQHCGTSLVTQMENIT